MVCWRTRSLLRPYWLTRGECMTVDATYGPLSADDTPAAPSTGSPAESSRRMCYAMR